jgi:hypothetical protein
LDRTDFLPRWSDIYFIPRAYFVDWIKLSNLFLAAEVFHEVAIPTMVHILDRTYRHLPSLSTVESLGDCWGNCCARNPIREDILWRRCGHRLDYLKEGVTQVHYDRLREETLMLGTPLKEKKLPKSPKPIVVEPDTAKR